MRFKVGIVFKNYVNCCRWIFSNINFLKSEKYIVYILKWSCDNYRKSCLSPTLVRCSLPDSIQRWMMYEQMYMNKSNIVTVTSFSQMHLRNGMFPVISVNKEVTVISNPRRVPVWSSSHQARATPYRETWRTQDMKNCRTLAPHSWDVYKKEWFQWAQTFASSHI